MQAPSRSAFLSRLPGGWPSRSADKQGRQQAVEAFHNLGTPTLSVPHSANRLANGVLFLAGMPCIHA